jgi:hypothetical protein
MKTATMLAPRISEDAITVAHRIRSVMSMDLDEFDMADRARELNETFTTEQLHSAWHVLNSSERSAWKQLLTLERPNDNGY